MHLSWLHDVVHQQNRHGKICESRKVTLMSWQDEKPNVQREFVAREPQICHINMSKHKTTDGKERTLWKCSKHKWKDPLKIVKLMFNPPNNRKNGVSKGFKTTISYHLHPSSSHTARPPTAIAVATTRSFLGHRWTLKGHHGINLCEKMSWGNTWPGRKRKTRRDRRPVSLPLTAGWVSSHFPSAFIFGFVEHFGWMQHPTHVCARAHTHTQEGRMPLLCRATYRTFYRALFNFIS